MKRGEYTMDFTYKFADFKNDREIMNKIDQMERELSDETGKKVVLVAYDGRQILDHGSSLDSQK
jgi:hypothetical protein